MSGQYIIKVGNNTNVSFTTQNNVNKSGTSDFAQIENTDFSLNEFEDMYGVNWAASPQLFFSDLTDAPRIGWDGSNTKGAAVSVWGLNLGSSREDSYITVGGVNLTSDSDYAEWGATTNPTTARGLQRITFWLNSNIPLGEQDVTVTVNGVTSPAIKLYVRDTGNIYFVSPSGSGDGSLSNPFSPTDFSTLLSNGEDGVVGYFRSGIYSGEYAHPGWHANFCLGDIHSGTLHQSNAFVAYPGEIVEIRADGTGGADRSNFRLYSTPAEYITVAKFKMYANQMSTGAWNHWRVVGNDIDAIHTGSATGSIAPGDYQHTYQDVQILGNSIHGGTSGSKLDHAIYPGSGGTQVVLAYNHIYDNNFGSGPMISINCNQAAENNLLTDVIIKDNLIDVTAYPSRAIGVFETGDGSTIKIYNNVIKGHAPGGNPSVYGCSGTIHVYNNTLYNCGADNMGSCLNYYSMDIYGHHYVPTVDVRNNILYANSNSIYYFRLQGDAVLQGTDRNVYYGIVSVRSDDKYHDDSNGITSDPLLIDPANNNFHLQSNSPARNSGVTIADFNTDYEGISRPQGSAWDRGAYEYDENDSPPPSSSYRTDVNNNSQTNSTDALLTLRHSLGLSMTDTDWQESSITGDANCDGTTNSTDALLILRYSLGLDMNGTGWCGG